MTVEYKASHRYARMAPRKAEMVMDMIRGRSAGQALDTLQHDRHRASVFVHKVLASAVANAMQNPAVRPNRLVVSKAYVHCGPLLFGRMRFRPGPMGRAMPFRRRTCHLHVHVADPGVAEQVVEESES
jgi:large subunit ribosomal protein L22